MVKAIVVVALLGLVLAAAGFGYVEWAARTPIAAGDATEIRFEVAKGASLNQVGRALAEAGHVRSELALKLWIRLHGPVALPKAGKHPITRSMTVPQLLAALANTPLSEDVPVTLVEGWRLRDSDAFLAAQHLIEPGEYIAAASDPSRYKLQFELPREARDLSGYLLPETYMVPPGRLDVAALVQRQLDAFYERFMVPSRAQIAASQRPLHTIVIMASLLEREERDPLLRAQVAGVLYKRLDRGMALGVDATSRFTLENWNDRPAFLKMLLDKTDPYNTRHRPGLPPGPIGAPGLLSLTAAISPQPTEYWYYLHDKQGQIRFGRDLKEHEANRRAFGVW